MLIGKVQTTDDVNPLLHELSRYFGFRRSALVLFSNAIPVIFDSDPARYSAAWKYLEVFQSSENRKTAERLLVALKLNWLTGDRYEPGSAAQSRATELDLLDGAAVIVTSDGTAIGSIFLSGLPQLNRAEESAIVMIGHILFSKLRDLNSSNARRLQG